MKALIQRVKRASVTIGGELYSKIDKGLLVFLGVEKEDTVENCEKLSQKVLNLRIFEDENDKMNLSVNDVKGEILVVSQFTLYGDARKGRRPSFSDSMPPAKAEQFYNEFLEKFKASYSSVQSGRFQADMDVALVNSGPVTILLDSKKQF